MITKSSQQFLKDVKESARFPKPDKWYFDMLTEIFTPRHVEINYAIGNQYISQLTINQFQFLFSFIMNTDLDMYENKFFIIDPKTKLYTAKRLSKIKELDNLSFSTVLAYNFSFINKVLTIINPDKWGFTADNDHVMLYSDLSQNYKKLYKQLDFPMLSHYEPDGARTYIDNGEKFTVFFMKKEIK